MDEPQRLVLNTGKLQGLAQPLGARLALLELRDEAAWQALCEAAGHDLPAPDFSRGAAVGVVSLVGQPVDGEWPLGLDAVRVMDGAGLVVTHFKGGTYLPDGSACAEVAFVPGLEKVLVLDISGARFYPGLE